MTDGSRPVYARTIRAEARRTGDDELEVTARLVDEGTGTPTWFDERGKPIVHDMSLTIRVRYPDLIITHVSGGMSEHPYTVCPDAVPALDRLVGVSVAQGFTRAVNERLGRQNGCAHLTALVHAMGPVVMQGAGAAFLDESEPPRPGDTMWWVNTCHAWREGGPLASRIEAGDVAGFKALAARPGHAAERRDTR